jgi:alpha-D-ribose 1-methylphosphonate 5-triphosphate diphosphatase PhnM
VEKILDDGLASLFSVMDHSPGYTRFSRYDDYKNYVGKNSTLKGDELDAYVEEQWEKRFSFDYELQEKIVKLIQKYGVIFATHDDDSPERFDTYRQYGVTICEFLLMKKTAAYVMENNYFSVVGAPNLFRNMSMLIIFLHGMQLRTYGEYSVL